MKGIFKGVYRNKGAFTDQKTGEYVEYDHAVFTVLIPFKNSKAHIEGVGQEAAQKMKCLWGNLDTCCNTDDYDDGKTTFKSCAASCPTPSMCALLFLNGISTVNTAWSYSTYSPVF